MIFENFNEFRKANRGKWENKDSIDLAEEAWNAAINCSQEMKESYFELLWAVEDKYPDETRHETALRLIKESSGSNRDSSKEAKTNKVQ